MDQDFKSAVPALKEFLKVHGQGLNKEVKSKLTAIINTFKATGSTSNDGAETSAPKPEQKARAQGDTEMGFMEASFRAIIEILETNRDTEPFPKPVEREKETLGECYKYALKVAGLCKERKSALDHAYNIIGEIHNQVMEVEAAQAQEGSEQPTISFTKGSEMKAEQEKKVRTASPSLQKKTDTTSNKKKETIEKDQTVPTKTVINIEQEIEMKRTAISSALNKLKDTKGALERSSKIIQELYNQVMEVNGDQDKLERLVSTTSNKRANDAGQTTPKEIDPDIGKELDVKAASVFAAFKKMKAMKGDLDHAYNVIEEIHNQVMQVDVVQGQERLVQPATTSFEKVSECTRPAAPIKTVHEMKAEQEKKVRTTSPSLQKKTDITSSTKKGSTEKVHTVPTEAVPNEPQEIEMKRKAVSSALDKLKDTKCDFERVCTIIEDLHNQAKEINVYQAQEKQETLTTTGFKKDGVDMRSTVPKPTEPGMTQKQGNNASDVSSSSKKTTLKTSGPIKGTQETDQTVPTTQEPNFRKELEMKAAKVSEALKKFKDTKREAEYASCLLKQLSSLSHATNRGDDGNVLSRPLNAETPHAKGKDAKNVENPKQKSPQCVHDENLDKSYKFASLVLKDMRESERVRVDLEQKRAKIEELKSGLKRIQDENTKLRKEADSLRIRLSEHAAALLNHDNPAIADLSDPNRPAKLGEKYLELYDNQWTNAFCNLKEENSSASDEELTGYLYNILIDGYVFCKDARQAQIFNLQEIMLHPTGDIGKSRRRPIEDVGKMYSNHLSDAAKLSSNVTSANIAKAFLMNEETKKKHGQMIKPCKTYIQECLRLCWLMQVQAPPLCLDLKTAKGHTFEKNSYKEYTIAGKKIAFVVWPALFLQENGPLLSKGVAQGDSA